MNAEAEETVQAEPKLVKYTPEQIERFWSKVDKTSHPGGCWVWTACKDKNGYGQVGFNGKVIRAHRASFEITYGKLGVLGGHHGMCVLHSCDNPPCVNPDHLWTGTNHENILDKVKKGRAKVGIGERQHLSKLTTALVLEIRNSYVPRKVSHRKLAAIYNIDKQTVARVLNRKTWWHV
jgi:hypothetical protein